MRDQLRSSPVTIGVVRAADAVAGVARGLHLGGLQPHLELDVDCAVLAIGR